MGFCARRARGLPALENNKFADPANTPDYGFAQGQSGRCFNCCALRQALYYLGQASNSGNPSEAERHDRMLGQQKELGGTILALMDQDMLNSPITGNLVSPDEDMREWMVVAYSSVRGTRTEKDMSNWGFVRCPPAIATQAFKDGKGGSLSVMTAANTYDICFIAGNDLGNACVLLRCLCGRWILLHP